jgi:hypothetical protein
MFLTSPHAFLFGYFRLALYLLRTVEACLSLLVVFLLLCRQLRPVLACGGFYACLRLFCFVSLRLNVLLLLAGAHSCVLRRSRLLYS